MIQPETVEESALPPAARRLLEYVGDLSMELSEMTENAGFRDLSEDFRRASVKARGRAYGQAHNQAQT